jgi:hypothetical protein
MLIFKGDETFMHQTVGLYRLTYGRSGLTVESIINSIYGLYMIMLTCHVGPRSL